jgi:hypothetical protein
MALFYIVEEVVPGIVVENGGGGIFRGVECAEGGHGDKETIRWSRETARLLPRGSGERT